MSDEKAVGTRYEGHSGVGRDSQWLTNEDLQVAGKTEAAVRIEAVKLYRNVVFAGGRKKDAMIALKFAKVQRELGLNATNRKALNAMFGKLTKAWVGQTITLYVAQAKLGGETVDCLRIREQRSKAATAAEDLLKDEPVPKGDAPAFQSAADVLGLDEQQRAEVLDRHGNDYDAAHAELADAAGQPRAGLDLRDEPRTGPATP